MKNQLSSLLVSLLLAGTSAQAAGPTNRLLAATATDQVPAQLQSESLAKSATATLDHQPSQMSWAIDPQSVLTARPTPFVKESREYWMDATATELQRGLKISTSAKGALVRLSPHADNLGVIDASTLSFRANGKLYTSTDGMRTAADQDALQAAGMDVPQGSLVIKLSDTLGSGDIELIAPSANGSYLIHVFEPASPIVLSLQAERDTVISGEALRIRAILQGGATLDRLSGLLSSPDGHAQSVDFARQNDGSFVASVVPDAAHAGGFGLWEIHAFGNARSAQFNVPRDARNAFAVSVATAQLNGSVEKVSVGVQRANLTIRVGVQAASASRYQLAGVLYGTRADGSLGAAVVAHSAAWMESGAGTIDLQFDADSLKKSGVVAPFELRDLRLINQADMSLIERRERAALVH